MNEVSTLICLILPNSILLYPRKSKPLCQTQYSAQSLLSTTPSLLNMSVMLLMICITDHENILNIPRVNSQSSLTFPAVVICTLPYRTVHTESWQTAIHLWKPSFDVFSFRTYPSPANHQDLNIFGLFPMSHTTLYYNLLTFTAMNCFRQPGKQWTHICLPSIKRVSFWPY